jgi:hypothetical protein
MLQPAPAHSPTHPHVQLPCFLPHRAHCPHHTDPDPTDPADTPPPCPPGKMIFGVEGVDPARRSRLIELLDIDLYQRLTTMSDGQRRRVQICMGLLKPYDVLLMDEITVDMDVVGRLDLLDFFK